MAVAYGSNLNRLKTQAADRAHTAVIRKLGKALAPPQAGRAGAPPPPIIRWATVDTVNPDGTVNLTLDGGTIPSVARKTGYSPAAGDTVLVEFHGGDLVVDGTIGGTAIGGRVVHGMATVTADSTAGSPVVYASAAVALAGGAIYNLFTRFQCSTVTATPSFINLAVDDTAGLIVPGTYYVMSLLSPTTGATYVASSFTQLAPTVDVTTTITFTGNTGGSGALRIGGTSGLEYTIIRCA